MRDLVRIASNGDGVFTELELNRMRWRSRRGMLELDLLLQPFFDEEFRDLPHEYQLTFVKLLEQDDPDLLMWFSNKAVPDDQELAELVQMILKRVQP
jgi:antitoxin CptB